MEEQREERSDRARRRVHPADNGPRRVERSDRARRRVPAADSGPRRVTYLLARALDGELSRLEAEELERMTRADPELRRRRAGWQRVERALGPALTRGPGLDLEAMAARIAAAQQRAPLTAATPLAPPSRASRLAWAALGAAALALGALWTQRGPAAPPALAQRERVPVEVAADRAPTEAGLVTIRF
jgi:anti-sigma factor RsiW